MFFVLALIAVAAVLALMRAWQYLALRRTRSRLSLRVAWVKMAFARHLMRRYEAELPDEEAARLAAAVSNELFGDSASNEEGLRFLAANREAVGLELLRLRQESVGVRRILTDALRIRVFLDRGVGPASRALVEGMESAILIPGGDFPNPADFLRDAEAFARTEASD